MPLLQDHAAHAVLFAPSYWMAPSGQRAPGDLFMSWEQLRACVKSGLVDVQSHAHRHALVHTCARLVDFANPRALARFDIYDWPMRMVGGTQELGKPPLGTPVYSATPLLSASRRYLENSELTMACRQFVQQLGGPEFFADAGWRRRLHAFHRSHGAALRGRYMSDSELDELIASEFTLSREKFRSQLGYAPTCIAYPWMLGSRRSLELARRSGFRVAFGVALDYGAQRRSGTLPLAAYGRLKCDWLRCLPGAGRASAWSSIGRKLSGLSALQHLAH